MVSPIRRMSLDDLERLRDLAEQLRVKQAYSSGPPPGMGIPDRNDFGDLSKLTPGQLVDFVVQHHLAQRAGPHFDYRLGTPDLGLYSWASKHEMPEPGERRAWYQQPVHQHAYGNYEGVLRGYGSGVVRRHRKGEALITDVTPDKISFTTADERYPQRFALVRSRGPGKKTWLLLNTTPRQPLPYDKIHYDKISADKVESLLDALEADAEVQPKVDGASVLVQLGDNGLEIASYRRSAETGRPIVHTERVLGTRKAGYQKPLPKELAGSILQGELYGVRRTLDGKEEVLAPQEIGALLNSALGKTLRAKKEGNIALKVMLFNARQRGKEAIDALPYAERKAFLQQVAEHLDPNVFHLAEGVTGPQAKTLWQQIREGKHPLTREGIVIHRQREKPLKAKLLDEQDVHIVGTFPGEGKYKDKAIGGFLYAMEPGGRPVGKVGTGLSDEIREDAAKNPEAYIGRVARVRSQGAFPSGALRAPSFLALHEDESPKEKSAAVKMRMISISILRTTDIRPEESDDEPERPPIVAIDLDGTLAEEQKEFDPEKIGQPRPGAAEAVQAMYDDGWHIIIHTVRGNKRLVAEWLDKHRIPYDEINSNIYQPEDSSQKICADLYIDDKAVDGRRSWDWLLQYARRRLDNSRHGT